MPWGTTFKADLKRFRSLTMGFPIVMGRKTQESIGKFLEGRPNLIITKNHDIDSYLSARYSYSDNIEDALKWSGYSDIFIIGGASIYEQTIDIADRIYLTEIKKSFECDTYFPEIDLSQWKEVSRESFSGDFDYDFVEYIKL